MGVTCQVVLLIGPANQKLKFGSRFQIHCGLTLLRRVPTADIVIPDGSHSC